MSRRKEVQENEIVISRMSFWLPNMVSYMDTKNQLVGGCAVVIKKIEHCGAKNGHKSLFGSPECNRNQEEPSVFLTPQQTPTSIISDSYPDSECDPFYWLDTFDDLTQLLIGSLMTQQYQLFANTLNAHNHHLQVKHLILITEVLGKFTCIELMHCLEISFENEPCAEVRKTLKSIILELIFNEVRKSENYNKKCMRLISIADKYNLNLLKKMKILNPYIKKMPVSLLLVEFLLMNKSIDDAVYILSHKKIIMKFFKRKYVLNDELWMFSLTLLHTFRVIYQMKLPILAYELAITCLTQNVLPLGVEIWGSLALLTILDESECNIDNLRQLFQKLIKSNIAIPNNLQRAVIIELNRKKYKKINRLFLITPAYSCFTECLPLTGPIKCKLRVNMVNIWTNEEMRLAVRWLNDTIKAKKAKPDVKCIVSFMTILPENYVIDDGVDGVNAPINQDYFLHSDKSSKKRFKKIIDSSQLEIAFTFN